MVDDPESDVVQFHWVAVVLVLLQDDLGPFRRVKTKWAGAQGWVALVGHESEEEQFGFVILQRDTHLLRAHRLDAIDQTL